jgi:hypothetical protein
MSGGQHRNDEANGPSRSGERENGKKQKSREQIDQTLLRRQTGVLRKIKN